MAVARDRAVVCTHRAPWFELLEVGSGHQLLKCEVAGNRIISLDVTPDARLAVTGGEEGTARLWDMSDGRCLRLFEPRAGSAGTVRFDAAGRRILVVSSYSVSTVWDAGSGKVLARFDCPSGVSSDDHGWSRPVSCGTFSPDAARVAVALWDGSVYVWPVDTLAAVRSAPPQPLTSEERLVYLPPGDAEPQQVEMAAAIVRRLLDELALVDDVLDSVERDATLDGPTRAVAKLLLEGRTDDAADLNDRAWSVVAGAEASAAERAQALRWAQAATRLAPADVNIANTLGVAQYRCEKFAEALETLTRCDRDNAASPDGSQPSDLAFLAMAQHRLGHSDQSKKALARLRELMTNSPHKDVEESKRFLAEAEALIEGKGSK